MKNKQTKIEKAKKEIMELLTKENVSLNLSVEKLESFANRLVNSYLANKKN
jgi:hypothetical protein